MAYTDNILLTLRNSTDFVDVEGFNRDNRLLDSLLAPVAVSYGRTASAAELCTYNIYQMMLENQYNNLSVRNKKGLFFGRFTSAADSAENAFFNQAAGCYIFGDSVGTALTSGAAGDEITSVSYGGSGNTSVGSGYSFSITASSWCRVTAIEVSGDSIMEESLRLKNFYAGSTALLRNSTVIGAANTTRASISYTLATPVIIKPGDVVKGIFETDGSSYTIKLYGAQAGTPYIRVWCEPVSPTGWLASPQTELGDFGHSLARVYIQADSETAAQISPVLTDGDGNTYQLTYEKVRDAVLPGGTACRELCYQCPYTHSEAGLKINVAANPGGAVKLLGYGVTVM